MNKEHPISDEVLELAKMALARGDHWMAYNQDLYFIDKDEVYFFNNQNDAKEFARDNFNDRDTFYVMRFESILDILKKIPYGLELSQQINKNLNNKHKQLSLFNSHLKTNVMNNENFQYLSDNIKYNGFGENLKSELGKNMNEGQPEFQLHYKAEINKKPFEANLNFRKSNTSDMYFFNNYHASLEKSNGEKAEHTFYLNKGKGFTSKEAYNLLDGRAVHKDLVTKEGQPYNAWVQIDSNSADKNLKQYHENYGFDLKSSVEKFAIDELKDPEKEKALMQSLQKGNVQSVIIEKDGAVHKMFIEADPQFKKINLYDSQMKLVQNDSLSQYKAAGINESKEAAIDKKKELQQEIKPEEEKPEKKNNKSLLPKSTHSKNRQIKGKKKESRQVLKPGKKILDKKNNTSLLPKKRTHTKKGMGVS